MKVFVAGATGAIGRALVPMLVAAGHEVAGTTRAPGKRDVIGNAGATPVVVDGLDREAVRRAVTSFQPAVVIHELTALKGMISPRRFDREFAATNGLRTKGTDNLLAAARAGGASRFIAQGFTGWPNARTGAPVKTEQDPLDPHPPPQARQTLAALRYLEDTVPAASGLEGIVVRYGTLYGPGTAIGDGGEILRMVSRRMLPVVGDGAGVWSFIHVEDAARATVAALEHAGPGLYNIVDDDPAPVAVWLPHLAQAIGARPPRHLPTWLVTPVLGQHGLAMMTQARGSSNAKAKRALGWQPAYPSWRQGFTAGLR